MTRTTLGLVGACALGFAALFAARNQGACPDDKKPSLSQPRAEAFCPGKKPTVSAPPAAACPDDKKPSLA